MEFPDQVLLEVIRSEAWMTEPQIESCLSEREQSDPEVRLLDFCHRQGYLDEEQARAVRRVASEGKALGAEMANAQSIAKALRVLNDLHGNDGGARKKRQGRPTPAEQEGPSPSSDLSELVLEALVAEGRLTAQQQKEAEEKRDPDQFIGSALVNLGSIGEQDLTAYLCQRLHTPYLSPKSLLFDDQLLSSIPADFCLEHQVVPLAKTGNYVTVALVNPPDEALLSEIFALSGSKPLPALCTSSDFAAIGERLLEVETPEVAETEEEAKEKGRKKPSGEFLAVHSTPAGRSPAEVLKRLRLLTKNKDLDVALRLLEAGGSVTAALKAIEELEDSRDLILEFLSDLTGRPFLSLLQFELDPELASAIPAEFARIHAVVPLAKIGHQLTVGIENPLNITTLDELRRLTGLVIRPVIVPGEQARSAVKSLYPEKEEEEEEKPEGPKVKIRETEKKQEIAGVFQKLGLTTPAGKPGRLGRELTEQDVIHISDVLLADAIRTEASDIHVELYEEVFQVRYRTDGTLRTVVQAPPNVHAPVVSRLKIMSNLDIAEHRVPQDGRLKVTMDDADIDFRVSTLPTIFGEKVVMRILDKRALRLDLNDLGFGERCKKHFLEAIGQPHGMVLVTGPTGSGKSTTLYSALGTLNTDAVNLITVEDPVEYNIHGINQVPVNAKVGLTFAGALRSILRQDPDIVMLGEIRDGETAAIAIQAALTGHLVLSTLHTNDAPSSISRLLDMDIEPFLLAASLNLIQAQRLIRKICPACKRPEKIPATAFQRIRAALPESIPDSAIVAFAGDGCDACGHTGYKGRSTIVEVLPVGPELKELIAGGAPQAKITDKAIENGFETLFQDGVNKILAGSTSIEEVFAAAAD